MAYNDETGIVSGPAISIGDISDALGSESGDLGTLCTSDNINIFAKYKPQRSTVIGELTNVQRAADNWGFPFSGEYRIKTATIQEAVTQYYLNDETWPLLKPRGNTVSPAEPYRMLDFRNASNTSGAGYYSEAPNIVSVTCPPSAEEYTSEKTVTVTITRPNLNYTLYPTLYFTDFSSVTGINDMKFTLVYWDQLATSTKYISTSSTKVSELAANGTATATFTISLTPQVNTATYKGIVVVTDITNLSNDGTAIYIPESEFTFTYTRKPVIVNYSGAWGNNQSPVYGGGKISFGGSCDVTFATPSSGTSTYGQPYKVVFKVYANGGTTPIDTKEWDIGNNIPSDKSTPVTIDTSLNTFPFDESTTEKTWFLDLSSYTTATLVTELVTTGPSYSGQETGYVAELVATESIIASLKE